jgi:hypothetical protein
VGYNMSWIFLDGIDEETLYDALDLAVTAVTPDRHDLGTSNVPLAGAAQYLQGTHWLWTRR